MVLADAESSNTYLIVGLGNPGRTFRGNRHNAGFMLVSLLSAELGFTFTRRQMNSLVADGSLEGRKVILAKPMTFVNRAGQSVAALVRFYRVTASNLLVATDDLDLDLGSLRMRPAGGSGGHKGLQSIITSLGTREVPRLRVGIGRPPGRKDPADYVLENFSEQELLDLQVALRRGVECLLTFLREGIQEAMSACNRPEN